MENRVMSLQILQRHRAVSLPQHGFIEYISDHSNAETARNTLSASWYLKSIVTGASISLVTIAKASPEMDHWPALRAATKGPPAGWWRPRGRPRQTWSLWTVETDLRPANVGLHTAWHRAQDRSHWLEWTHGDNGLHPIMGHATDDDENWRIASLVFYFSENQT